MQNPVLDKVSDQQIENEYHRQVTLSIALKTRPDTLPGCYLKKLAESVLW